jgi:hypothetical protein
MFEDLLHIRAVFAYNGEFTTVSSLSAHLFQPERYTAIRPVFGMVNDSA